MEFKYIVFLFLVLSRSSYSFSVEKDIKDILIHFFFFKVYLQKWRMLQLFLRDKLFIFINLIELQMVLFDHLSQVSYS